MVTLPPRPRQTLAPFRHGTADGESSPKPVEALMGQYVVQVGCGESATLPMAGRYKSRLNF